MSGNKERAVMIDVCPRCGQGVYFTLVHLTSDNDRKPTCYAYVYVSDRGIDKTRFTRKMSWNDDALERTMTESNNLFCPGCVRYIGKQYVAGALNRLRDELRKME